MNCYHTRLTREGLLALTGPDASTFLQGQVTCDLRNLSPTRGMPGVYCSVQGRVICDFLLSQIAPDHLLLRMRRDILSPSLEVLSKYSVFSKVALEVTSDQWQLLGCWGEDCSRTLLDLVGAVPEKPFEAVTGEGFVIIRTPTAGDMFECYLDANAGALAGELESRFSRADENEWHLQQVQSGVARIEASTSGEFVPQVLNYDLSSHISFNKGCYTGQEVVARLHYRGKPKRRLYYADFNDSQNVDNPGRAAGAPVFGAQTKRAIGNLINVAHAGEGRYCALITATDAGASTGLYLNEPQGPALRIGEPPLAVAASE